MKIKGRLVDIHQRIVYPAEIEIEKGIIKNITKCNECPERFIMPGLIDAHVHVESSMVSPSSFAETAVRHGTIGVVSDPHEIANVTGLDGIEFMLKDSKKVPMYFWFGAPSCVPATNFETSGGRIEPVDVNRLLQREEIKYLSEMMNFPGVISGDSEVIMKIESAKRLNKPIDGHAPGLKGDQLKKYIDVGITTDHECSSLEEAVEKIKLGMKVIIREGSAARNLEALKNLFKIYPEMIMLCSDDIHPEMLKKRHINKLVSKLVKDGYSLFDVISSCTLNPVEHYGLESGLLRTGDSADFIIVDDPAEMNISETWIKGKKIFVNGNVNFLIKRGEKFNRFRATDIKENDIRIKRSGRMIRVIVASDGELLTGSGLYDAGSSEFVNSDISRDILKIVVKDRYNDCPPSVGFIKGFGLKKGAFASSVAHDSHNIICIGTDDKSISNCVNEIVRLKGGLCVNTGRKISSLQLGIAGIMSDDSVDKVASAYEALTRQVIENGCKLSAPFMTLSFMALLVIPELKISDRGLFNGKEFRFTDLFTDREE